MIPAAPKLRFPEFKDPWKPGHAGDAFNNSRAKGEAGLPIYSVTMDRGLVRRDSLDRHMAADAADGQNLRAQRGDIVYNMMRMWQGAVGLAQEESMVSPAYVVLSPKKHTSAEFFDQWFKAKRMLYLLGAYSHGITSDRLRLYADDFASIPLHLPTLPEQKKIAAFLGALDAKLTALATKQAALRQFKAGLIQKLYSQQIRFARDDGTPFPEWQEKRLGDLATFHRGGALSRSDLDENGKNFCIHYGELFTIYGETINQVRSRTNTLGFLSAAGDVIMPSSDVTPDGLATASALKAAGIVLGGDINIIRLHEGMIPEFVSFGVTALRRRFMRLVTGTTVKHLYLSDVKDLKFPVPHHDEQKKIANALSVLNSKLSALVDQMVQIEQFKKGLLQQMYV